MHVQTDFVTNSSSTAYIVFVPDSFYATDKHINKAKQKYKLNYDAPSKDLKEVALIVEMIKNGDQFDIYSDENLWILCFEIFSNEGFIVDGIECNSGNTIMKGVKQENIISTITEYVDWSNIVNILVKGVNNERQNKE